MKVVPAPPMPATRIDNDTQELDTDELLMGDRIGRGEAIGRYIVLDQLGIGGMGAVYSAWDPELDRKLAIKVVRDLHNKLGSERGRARLQREGQALARLRHPNVIAVHDVGTDEGRVFVAMEYVDGETLQSWLQRSPKPPLGQLIEVFVHIGRGLAAAHRAGLVHRDVKPDNVMIGDDGRVLVLDFGIARVGLAHEVGEFEAHEEPDHAASPTKRRPSDALETPLATLTRAGARVGTPAYMSPEQHSGGALDPRTDQFSYCVVMWEALTGARPYGDGVVTPEIERMQRGQLAAFTNRTVPRRIVSALRRGLAADPNARFPSMEALLEALNPRPLTLHRRLQTWAAVAAGLGLLAGILGTLAATSIYHHRQSASEPTPSTSERAPLDPKLQARQRSIDALERSAAPGDPAVATARRELARTLAAHGEYEAATIEYERALIWLVP